eukprot:m.10546 g.10546  ORF g.10546 m.10546 type:complete len:837 (-) comp6638_c0_seq2:2236-4746(-)
MKRKVQSIFLKASARGHADTVTHLLQQHGRALLTSHTSDGSTAVLLAAKRGQLEVLKLLFDFGAHWTDTDADNKRQGNVFHYACWGGHEDLVVWLIDNFKPDLNSRDVVGNTPLLYAVYGGHRHIVDLLLDRGCSLNEHNQKYHTAILQAACGGHKHLVTYLLSKDFSITERDHDGNTALLFAAWGGHRELMEFLLEQGSSLQERNFNGHSVFLSAANGGRTAIVEWLIEEGFDIHETNNNGDTALLLACYGGHHGLVKRLLELGARMTDRNSCGFTPLLSAANGGQREMASWLLSNGSNIDECDHDGYSALILAACGGNVPLVEFFLNNGASLTEKNSNGDTPLLLAAYCGHTDLVEWLLTNGSSAFERNNSGMGVLVSAANGGHADTVRALHRRLGAHCLEEKDEGGYTPLLLACQRGHMDVVQYLACYGANVHAHTTRHDSDALALAADHPALLQFLTYIWELNSLEIACVLRECDRVHEMLRSGIDPTSSSRCLEVAKATDVFPDSPPVDEELVRLVNAATCPWTPLTHELFSPNYRKRVVELLWVKKQLDLHRSLPFLPTEMWLHIMSFVERSCVQEDYASTAVIPFSNEQEAIFRVAWRHKYLHTEAERQSCSKRMAVRRRSSIPHIAELDCYSSASLIEIRHVDLINHANCTQQGRISPFLHSEDNVTHSVSTTMSNSGVKTTWGTMDSVIPSSSSTTMLSSTGRMMMATTDASMEDEDDDDDNTVPSTQTTSTSASTTTTCSKTSLTSSSSMLAKHLTISTASPNEEDNVTSKTSSSSSQSSSSALSTPVTPALVVSESSAFESFKMTEHANIDSSSSVQAHMKTTWV